MSGANIQNLCRITLNLLNRRLCHLSLTTSIKIGNEPWSELSFTTKTNVKIIEVKDL